MCQLLVVRGGANANNSLARPNITSADLLGTTLTMSGTYCNTGTFTLEFYKAVGSCATGDCDGTATPRVAGEGQTYLGRLTGLTGGTFTNQNMTIPSGILAYGDSISVIAIRTAGTAIGDTSEFSINYTLRNISGIVFEDVTGNALTDGDVVLDDASGDQQGRGGVTVCAFKDNGDAIPNASDSLILCTQTASSGSIGAYQFPAGGLVTGKYWIAVQASQIIPSAGGTGLAEQTYAGVGTAAAGITSRNVRCVGAPTTYSANQQQTTSGACYGGKTGDVADGFVGTLLSLANAEHIAELNIDASQIAQLTDLNFGFSFNVVTNTNDTGQGSLRQFVNNANTVTGANAMRFVPAVVTNASGSGQTWWRTTVNTVLPTITGVNATNTTVDGTAYSNTDGITVVETNTANIGSNVTVGTNALPLWVTPMPAPELELTGNTAVVINDGFVVDAGNVTIRRMAIQGFSNAVDGGTESLIRVGTSSASSFTNTLIEENVIGNNPIVSLPRYTGGNGVAITGADNGIIRRNIIARTGDCLIVIGLAGDPCAISGGSATLDNVDNWQILNNELFDAVGHGGLYSAAISIKNAVGASPRTLTIAQNYIHDNITGGIATSDIDTGRYAISNNTITGNAVALSPRMGVRMGTTGVSQVFDNVIKNNQGPGLWITGAGRNINAGRNIYGGNTGNAVDLSASTSADGVTLNNTSCLNQNGASSGNAGAARPVITSASLVGTTLTVSGTYCSTLDPFAVIEIYEAVGAGTQNGSANNDYGSDNQMAGEGIQFLGHGIGSAGTFTASLDVTGKGLTVNSLISAIVGGGGTLNIATEFSANIGLLGLSGVVYEDVNYGGGAGRDLATSSGVGRDSVRVELYKETSAGSGVYTYVSSTTTSTLSGQAGSYQFGGLMAANYRVRVVNNTTDRVSSSRAGDDSSVYGVQTYRTDASTGSAVAVSNEIGGRTPAFTADAANVTTVGGAFPDGGSSGTQTLYWAPVALSSAAVTGVDFGFNFDTIVNVADCANPSATVQCLGSLRQFVNNANLLSNTGLAQALPGAIASDYTTGDEVSIFMVPTAALSSGVAKVQLTSILPQVTGANAASTKLDGRTQTYNTTTSTGDTNSGMLGAGGVVGVDGLTLSQVNRPEVEITAQTPNLAIGLNTNAANVAVRGLSIWGFDTFVLVYDANNFIAQQNVLGSSATAFTAPAILPTQAGIQFPNAATGSNVLIENNLIGFTGLNGLYVGRGAVTNWTIRNNEFRRNGISPTAQSGLGEGIFIENFGNLSMLIEGNLLQQNDQQAVELDYGSGLTIRNNSLIANGARPQEQAQIFFYQASNSTISKNIIRDGFQDGILLTNNAATVTVSQNSIYNNTGLGINLVADYLEPNTGFIPTLNDANDADTGANGFLNFPIIQSAVLAGSNLIVSGCAPAGAIIELFEADVSPGGAATLGANTFTPRTLDYGEGQTYLSSITEGSAGDTDSGTCSSPIDDLDGNDQTGMNKFSFSIPIPSGIVSDDLLTATSTLANATSEFSPIAMVRSNDYGDAPLSYGQVGHAVIGPILGTLRDVDSSYPAAPGLLADADDTTGVDDEDALSTLPLVHAGMIGITNGYSLTIPVSNITANTNLCAWLDFNRDGTFASIEGVCSVLSSGTSSATLNFTVPNTLKVGDLYARLRITTNALSTADGGNTAAFTDGEVEDYYRADGIKPVVRINKTLSPATAGDLFKLEVTGGNATPASGASNPATNIGNGGSTGWIMVDQASSLTLAEHQWMSRPLTAFSTTINCTEGDGTTPHLVNSPSLAGAVMRSAILTAPATGAEGTAAQRICTFINVEPSVYSITGRVFTDTGAGNANDALQNGAEAGLSGVTVKLTNCSGTIYASTTTNSLGDYSFDASLAPAGTTCIEQTNLSGYLSTGANQSNTLLPDGTPTSVSGTSYTYTRSIDRIQFNLVSATSYTGLNFADIPASTLQPNGANTVLAGAIATYAHTFVAGSAGSVTFSASNTASPANPAWAHSLFADNDCNGILDLSAGDTPLTLTQSVTAGQTICILVRQNTPAGANIGDSNTITLGATINYTGAAPALGQTLTRTDLTTITNSTLVLQKQVRNLTQGGAWGNSNQAKSGDVLEYKISYTNTGSQALNTLQVNDATPAFTTFASAVCGSPLPASLSACVVSAQPTVGGVGAITWSFTGSLAPNGTVGEVTYQVTVQ